MKVRQGIGHQVSAFGEKARDHFAKARELGGQDYLAGVDLFALDAFCEAVSLRGASLEGGPDADVMVVFEQSLPAPGVYSNSS